MNKNAKKLSAQYLLKASRLFESKQWKIEDSPTDIYSHFNRYCKRLLDIGENNKRDLVLELTERYLWIPNEEYYKYLLDALKMFFSNETQYDEDTTIYVMPLIKQNDVKNVKSSSHLTYLFTSVNLRFNSCFAKYKFQVLSDINLIRLNLENENVVLLLVDDFIGTGETAEKCLLYLQSEGIDLQKVRILSLVSQERGIEYLSQYNLPIFSSIILKRGISDYYEGAKLERNIKLMKDIESKMAISAKFSFGYKQSEALVTMCRTPNNTFPIFWDEDGNYKTAPFPRF